LFPPHPSLSPRGEDYGEGVKFNVKINKGVKVAFLIWHVIE